MGIMFAILAFVICTIALLVGGIHLHDRRYHKKHPNEFDADLAEVDELLTQTGH